MSLSDFYWSCFIGCSLLVTLLQIYSSSHNFNNNSHERKAPLDPKFVTFQTYYLSAFLLAMFADWLQGPYIYELYISYGFNKAHVAELFLFGYASSMLCGTWIGGLADKYGRRNMCLLYCACYGASCVTKLFPDYYVLLIGRGLSGISTSLLFSVFESWMVCEHHKLGYDSALLADTFSKATFGNGVVAVTAGLIANMAAGLFGFSAPFVLAILPLVIVASIVMCFWQENHGNQSAPVLNSLSRGFALIRSDAKIAALGFGQSCFEGGMYTFVFMWTSAVKSAEEQIAEEGGPEAMAELGENTTEYLGLIFAIFMVCVMIGSTIFKMRVSQSKESIYRLPLFVHATACMTMAVTAVAVGSHPNIVYLMFMLFETCVGVFYPAYGCIKSEKIPEEMRSAVMNIFRIPLNVFVVALLLHVKDLSTSQVFVMCSAAHFVSLCCYSYFYYSSKESLISSSNNSNSNGGSGGGGGGVECNSSISNKMKVNEDGNAL